MILPQKTSGSLLVYLPLNYDEDTRFNVSRMDSVAPVAEVDLAI
jgi:hypothetical protein